jgi:DNA-binding GntR family transcriptional regulator
MPAESYCGGQAWVHSAHAGEVFDHIVTALMKGEIDPGEIIEQTALAQRLGVSSEVLKAALEQLEMRKLVERVPDVGARARVASQSELRELYEVRKALEGLACRTAATAMTNWELDDLEELLEAHGRNPRLIAGTGNPSQLNDPDFHFLIVCGSRNSRLIELLCDEVYYQLRLYRSWSIRNPARPKQALAEHQEILAALRARDGAAAEALMRRHIENAYASVASVERWRASPNASPHKKYVM